MAAQLAAVAPALRPPLRLDRRQLRRWARFDVRFGILERAPDVRRAFVTALTGPGGSRPSTRAAVSRAIRERGTTRLKPAASARLRVSWSTCE